MIEKKVFVLKKFIILYFLSDLKHQSLLHHQEYYHIIARPCQHVDYLWKKLDQLVKKDERNVLNVLKSFPKTTVLGEIFGAY